MLADNLAGTSPNEIASHAGNAVSRPTTLKILSAQKYLPDTVTALAPTPSAPRRLRAAT